MTKRIQGMDTQGNPNLTDMESRYIPPPGMTWQQVEAIFLRVGQLPQELPAGLLQADYFQAHKQSRANFASKRAVAIECMPGLWEQVFEQYAANGDASNAITSIGIPHIMTDDGTVPLDAASPRVLINRPVPTGFQMWIQGISIGLFPQTINELNYHYAFNLNGEDILNKNATVVNYGRPLLSDAYVPLGYDKTSWILAKPGTMVDLTVSAKGAIAASDRVRVSVFGFLEPAA